MKGSRTRGEAKELHSMECTITGRPAYNRVLVTGGAGFIGKRVVRDLENQGISAGVLDNLSVGLPMPTPSELVATFQIDIRDRKKVEEVFSSFKPKAVIHLAAVHHIPTCEQNPTYAMNVNIIGTQVVLDACEAVGVGLVILASSGAVYDWADGPLSEDATSLRPSDIYSICKLTNENQLAVWAARTRTLARVARIFNTIGHDDPNGHLIPDIVAQIPESASRCNLRLGNTQPKRDYIYVEDTAVGICAILSDNRKDVLFEAYNICSGKEYSVSELVDLIGSIKGVSTEVMTDTSKVRRIDRPHQLGDPSKAQSLLGWKAQLNFKAALKATLNPKHVPA